MLSYSLNAAMNNILNLNFRNQVLKLLVTLYQKLAVPDNISIAQCFVHLNDPAAAAKQLDTLSSGPAVSLVILF